MRHFQSNLWQRKQLTGQQRSESIRFTIGVLVALAVIAFAVYLTLFPNPLRR